MKSEKNPSYFQSVSPVDGTTLWSGNTTKTEEISDIMRRSLAAADRWRSTTTADRIEVINRFAEQLSQRKVEIAKLITAETGKLPREAMGEVSASIAKAKWSIEAMAGRRSTTVVGELNELASGTNGSQAPVRRIRYSPLGVALVLGPFNFPLHLPGGQIIPALLAGNTVVFKPSDKSTAVGDLMCQMWTDAGLPTDVLQMIVGGVDTAKHAIDCPEVGAVFLTGSRMAGQAIHRQLAGRPEVLLALELGGNNPVVVDAMADPETTAQVLSFSAFISSGQRCTCARRAILVEGTGADIQIETLVQQTKALTVGMPSDNPEPDLGPLVSEEAANGISQTYDQLLSLGCVAIVPLQIDESHRSLVHPSIVDASGLSRSQFRDLGELEWFGPLLVVRRAKDLDEAFDQAADSPYGLAAALLGGERAQFDEFASIVRSGIVNWNGPTTGAAGNLPFGGHGWSGNHRPAGYFAIDFCNEPVASIENISLPATDLWKRNS